MRSHSHFLIGLMLVGVVVTVPSSRNDVIGNTGMGASKAITLDTMNPNLVEMKYGISGPVAARAEEIEKELEKGAQKPFKKVIKANEGDAHAMGQKPITFIRQVLACVSYPELIDKYDFLSDVKQRAKEILSACGGGSVGSYSASEGIELIRRHVAEYIERRDGHPAKWDDIYLTAGATTGSITEKVCPSVLGQTAVDLVAKTPVEGEPSYPLWIEEKTAILDSLNQRAKLVADAFNATQGFKCNVVQGAMYAFPRIELPENAIEAAQAAGQEPDEYYALQLLEETGICIVPGSGFGQRPGTFHFRTTILPQPALLQEMLDNFNDFHQKFTQQYA